MGAKLANAATRSGSGNGWFRARIRKKFLPKAQGKFLRFDFPAIPGADAHSVNVKVGSHVTFTVGSKEPDIVHERIAFADAQLVKFLREAQAGDLSLDDSVIQAYARQIYSFSLKEYKDNTGLPSMQKTHAAYVNIDYQRMRKLKPIWRHWPGQCGDFDISNELEPTSYDAGDCSSEAMNYRVGLLVNWWLKENDIEISLSERTRLVRATDIYARQVIEESTIKVNDGHIRASAKARSGQTSVKRWTLTELIEHWAARPDTKPHTVRKYKKVVSELVAFLGHEIAENVSRVEMQAWSDHLVGSGKATNTINGMYLTATKLVFNYGNKMELIDKNPSVILTHVKNAKRIPSREPYTDQEVITIINAARTNTSPDLRWIPQLAATLGSRAIEVAQIHSSQIKRDRKHSEIWTIELNAVENGQSLKTPESMRVVPLHPDFFGEDFYAFVASRKGKFLFSDKEFNPDARSKHFEYIGNKIRLWVKTLDIDHVNKAPMHSFRHWFESRAMKQKQDVDLMKYIQGHKRDFSHANYRRNPGQDKCLALIKNVFSGLAINYQ